MLRMRWRRLFSPDWNRVEGHHGMRNTPRKSYCLLRQNLLSTSSDKNSVAAQLTQKIQIAASPSASGVSAVMVSWPFRLKFGKEGQCPCLGWLPQPPGSGALKMGWFSWVYQLQLAGGLQLAQALKRA